MEKGPGPDKKPEGHGGAGQGGQGGEDWGQRYAMLTKVLLWLLISQLRQAAFRNNPHKARPYAHKKIKVILEEQE